MSRNRADLGFGDELENFDPKSFAPQRRKEPAAPQDPNASRQVAEAAGFRSREARPEPAEQGGSKAQAVRRRRTGRNTQFNIKARPETVEAFCAVADAQGWGLGETLEHAVELLEQAYGRGEGGQR